ncbi:MAG: hypothetical protein ABF654_05270, partial [Gluconobacter potus]|uniref:hypothetical protein n=1 Tax=Gluconobacter potus TaxID=2724927 RepID=UPI0039EB1D0E
IIFLYLLLTYLDLLYNENFSYCFILFNGIDFLSVKKRIRDVLRAGSVHLPLQEDCIPSSPHPAAQACCRRA